MQVAAKQCVDCQADISARGHSAERCCSCSDQHTLSYAYRYYRTPEYKAKEKKRYIRDRERRAQYSVRPEAVARRRARQQSPEGKEAQARASRKHLLKKAEMTQEKAATPPGDIAMIKTEWTGADLPSGKNVPLGWTLFDGRLITHGETGDELFEIDPDGDSADDKDKSYIAPVGDEPQTEALIGLCLIFTLSVILFLGLWLAGWLT